MDNGCERKWFLSRFRPLLLFWFFFLCVLNTVMKYLLYNRSLNNNNHIKILVSSLVFFFFFFLPPPTLCPLQATTALSVCGCWTTGRACRRSRPTGKSTTRPFMTWPSTRPSRSLPVLAQMHSPRSLSDRAVIILVRKCVCVCACVVNCGVFDV